MLKVNIKKSLPDFELDVNFTLENGILGVCGRSGAGKTTLLQCIAGLVAPRTGCIDLNGRTFFSSEHGVNVPARSRNIGYLFQGYALFPHMTVKQNVLYGAKGGKGKRKKSSLSVLEVLDILRITGLQDRYPGQLSGGEQQRAALARALMAEPDLLLLDEPLSALDDQTRSRMHKELKRLQRQWEIPFIMVTHSRTELTALADRVLFLVNGKQCQEVIYNPERTCTGWDAQEIPCCR